MLYRDAPGGTVAIAQPAHAWVSGQLARAWGNDLFGAVVPRDEVCLAAEQHDVGMAEWEGAPTRNPGTGRAYSFLELPEPLHSAIFAAASRILVTQNRYAALLASRHFTGLAERHDLNADPPETARAIRTYLETERDWQRTMIAGLLADPHSAPHCIPATLERNSGLIAAWDWLSLRLLMGLRGPTEIPNVPTAAGLVTLWLTPLDDEATTVTIEPWPFGAATVELTCEGRQLGAPLADDAALQAALASAPWVTLQFTLRGVDKK